MILVSLAWMAETYYTWALSKDDDCRVALNYEDEDESLFRLENMNPGDVNVRTVTVTTNTSSANFYVT